MPLIIPANSAVSGGYDVANSLRFNSGSSDSLTLSTTAGNRTTWTFSTWFKRSKLGVLQSILEHDDSNYFRVRITSGDVFEVFDSNTNKLWSWYPLLRDTSSWYHIVIRGDSTDGTNGNRVRAYINGSLASANAVASIDQNYTFSFNQGGTLQIGKRGSTDYLDGYLAETILIDGSALAPTSFGEFDSDSGIWKPIDVSGLTFGDEGIYLEFKGSGTSANSSGLGADTSGNDHHFTVNNLTAVDQSTDTCTNNFATMNPLYTPDPGNLSAFSEGNLKIVSNSTSVTALGISTIGPSSGKWYAEFTLIAEASGESIVGAIYDIGTGPTLYGTPAYSVASNGDAKDAGTAKGANNWSGTYTTDDIISVALDLDNNKIYFAKNGSWVDGSGNWDESSPSAYFNLVASQDYFIGAGDKSTSQSSTWEANFGSPPYAISSGNQDADGFGNFEYAVPSGYFSLNTKNLAEYGG